MSASHYILCSTSGTSYIVGVVYKRSSVCYYTNIDEAYNMHVDKYVDHDVIRSCLSMIETRRNTIARVIISRKIIFRFNFYITRVFWGNI